MASVDREQSVVATTGALTTSPAPDSLCSPRNIRQRDSDDAPAVLMLPSAVSAQDPDAIIYDCQTPILPVSIRMKGLWWNNVVVSAELPIQVTPPGEVSQAQSPGLGTVRHVSEPDVLRGDAACIRVGVVPLGCNQYRPFRRLLVSTVRHTTLRLWDYGGRRVLPGLYRFRHVTISCSVWNVFQK